MNPSSYVDDGRRDMQSLALPSCPIDINNAWLDVIQKPFDTMACILNICT